MQREYIGSTLELPDGSTLVTFDQIEGNEERIRRLIGLGGIVARTGLSVQVPGVRRAA